MQSSKISMVLAVCVFSLARVNAGSISVRTVGYYQTWFEVTSTYNGENSTKFSGDIINNESETIKILDGAENIYLKVHLKSGSITFSTVLTKFYTSLDERCFVVYSESDLCFEEPCQKLPVTGMYSISINQTQDYPVFFDLTYEYEGSNLTHTSAFFSNGNKVAQIPDGATNINFILYENGLKKYFRRYIVVEKFYASPIEKCFEIYGVFFYPLWFEKPCKKLPAVNENFISVDQVGNRTVLLKVTYEYDGSNLTEYIEGNSNGERIIQIPDKATNINVTLYKESDPSLTRWISYKIEKLFTKLFTSPVQKCFQVYSYLEVFDDFIFEKSCHKLPAENGYSISVNQTGNYRTLFEINYEYNGLNLTESSGIFSKGEYKKVQIPDKATKINVTLYGHHSDMYLKYKIVSHFYPLPVEKCFQLLDYPRNADEIWSEESCKSFKVGDSFQSSNTSTEKLLAF